MDTKELIINRLQHLAIEQGLDMDNCKDIAEVYEKHLTKLQNTSSNSDYTKLPNIDELKSYMHRHKYLPNIMGTLEAIKKLGNFA